MSALEFLEEAWRREQGEIIQCGRCGTYMFHAWSPSGWVCSCSEIVPFEVDLGTRVIVSGGEVFEIGNSTNNDIGF